MEPRFIKKYFLTRLPLMVNLVFFFALINFPFNTQALAPADYLPEINQLSQKIYERSQQWDWHQQEIKWYKEKQTKLNGNELASSVYQNFFERINHKHSRWQNYQNKIKYHHHKMEQLHHYNNLDRQHCEKLITEISGTTQACPQHPDPGYWQLKDSSDTYKQERIKFVQNYADQVGMGDFKLQLVAQLHTENGSWLEDRLGDYGCSIGLSQINLCARKSLKNHPQINDWRWQIMAFIDEVKSNYLKYLNIERAQVGWNNPAAMVSGVYKTSYYYKIIKMKDKFEYINQNNPVIF